MVEVGQVEHLQVAAARSCLGPLPESVDDLAGCSAQAVRTQFLHLAADGGGSAGDLALVLTHAHHQCRGGHNRAGVAVDRLAGAVHPAS